MKETIKTNCYPLLSARITQKSKEDLKHQLDKIENFKPESYQKTKEELLSWMQRNILNKRVLYAGDYETQKLKTIKALKNKYDKDLSQELFRLEQIGNAEPLSNNLIITVEWKPSRMWGKNPKAFDNFGNESGSIGGCGYDKLSTATSEILNKHFYLIKLMCDKKERFLSEAENKLLDDNEIHRQVLGYGSGYSIIPTFEGGVGVSCHQRIIKGLNLNWQNVTSTKNIDVFIISF